MVSQILTVCNVFLVLTKLLVFLINKIYFIKSSNLVKLTVLGINLQESSNFKSVTICLTLYSVIIFFKLYLIILSCEHFSV